MVGGVAGQLLDTLPAVGVGRERRLEQAHGQRAVLEHLPAPRHRLGLQSVERDDGVDQAHVEGGAGVEEADIFIAATRGDNTNILVAQIAQRRYGVGHVIVRVPDPARSDWYSERGLHTICAVRLGITLVGRAIAESAGA